MYRISILLLLPIILSGCSVDGRPTSAKVPEPVRIDVATPRIEDGSVWQDSAGLTSSMTSDVKARSKGDIVTILIVEKNNAQRARQTDTSKTQNTTANVDQLFFKGLGTIKGATPKLGFDSKRSYSGGGTISDSGSVSATLAVQVIELLPSGNLVLKGSKEVTISGETQVVTISGIARPKDIAPDNTILSTNLAEARVHIAGKGPLEDAQRRTLTSRLQDYFNLF